ncbi:MAG TPA: MFS transporter [Spirochaetota bacterium]|nr:MFS transporter [Spirochaetota bacterium]HOR45245.1 MFS transporter [Spirochaetota bacterium]HPK57664.1 MFS transporter [Spirochaetota bacterium]
MSKSRRVIISLFLSILSFLFFYRNIDSFYLNPLKTEFSQVNPSVAVADSFNNLYIIDNSQRRFFKCSEDGILHFSVQGGLKEPDHFFYAEDIAVDDEGFVFILNRVTDNGGFFTEKEEVLCYDPSGKFHSVIFSKTHAEKKQILVQKGQLSRLEFKSGKLSWFDISENKIDYYVYEKNGNPHVEKSFDYPLAATYIADISMRGGNIYFTSKNGKLYKNISTVLYSPEKSKELSVPWSISSDEDGSVFVSDLAKPRILKVNNSSVSEILNASILEKNNIDSDGLVFYRINKSADKLILSSGSSIYVYSAEDFKIHSIDSVRYSFKSLVFRFVLYAVLIVFLISVFNILSFLYREVFHSKIPSMVSRSIVLIFAIGVSTFLVTMFILKNFSERYTRTITERSSQMVQLIPKAIDGDLISKIDTQEKFMNEDYRKIRSSLVSLFNNNKDPWNDRYYYAVYRVMNDSLYGFMYLNDGISTFHPFDYFTDPESSYRKAYSGEIISETDTDSWGSWIYALGPIKNSKGEVVAILEVGTDLYSFDRENMMLVKKVVIDVVTLLVVFILLLIEFTYLGQLSAKRSLLKKSDKNYSDAFFSRPVFFMYSFGISMSFAFIPLLMKKIYQPFLGMPQDVVIALAFSVEALFFAIFLFAGGIIVEKINWRNLKYIGIALSMTGLFICGFTSDMFIFLTARGIVGAGSGLILIACRSFINSESDGEKRSVAYSHFYSGGIAGVNAGAVFGAFFADQFGFSFAFYLAVSILLITLLISYNIFKNMKIVSLPSSEEHLLRSVVRFISNRKVMFYLILAVLPTYAAGMFLSYYVPLFSESHGLSVTDTGRLIILNGLFIIYLGPLLTRFFKRRMSDRNALILGSFGWAVSLVIYAATGSIGGVVAALVLMGIVEGFCVSAQNDYFMNLPIVKKIGSDRSVSYMELASRGAEMCAPVIFAYVLTIGARSGIALFAVGVIFMTIVFMLSSRESSITKRKGRA